MHALIRRKSLLVVWLLLLAVVGLALPAFAQESSNYDDPFYKQKDTDQIIAERRALGSPVALTDSSGTVMWRADYEPFGEISALIDNLQIPNTHQFIGKEHDPETGLHYFGARYYDGKIGRFLSVDPALRLNIRNVTLALPQHLNNYAYTANNPYRFVDRDGNSPVLVLLAGVVGGLLAIPTSPNIANTPIPGESPQASGNDAWLLANAAMIATANIEIGRLLLGAISNAGRAAAQGVTRQTLGDIIGIERHEVVNAVLKGRAPLESLSQAERRAAADFFRAEAERVGGRYKEAARLYNLERARYLEEGGPTPPGTLHEFIKSMGLGGGE